MRSIVDHGYWWPTIASPLYRPLTTLSYLTNYAVFGNGDRPFGYHAVNLTIHLLNALLLMAIVRRLVPDEEWIPPLAAAIWSVHPVATEAVTNIVGRADLLAAFGVLLGLYANMRAHAAAGTTRRWWLALLMLATAIAILSKESGVVILPLVVLYDLLWPGREGTTTRMVRWLVVLPPLIAFWWLRAAATAGPLDPTPYVDNPIVGAGMWTGRLTALAVAGRYLRLLIWPMQLSADYSFPQIPLATGSLEDWLDWTLVLGVVGAAMVSFRRERRVFFGLVAAGLAFLPVSNLLFATGTVMAERLLYLPAAFMIVAAVVALFAIVRLPDTDVLLPTALAVVVAALAVRTYERNRDWATELTLWTATANSSPRSFKSHSGLAEALYAAETTHEGLDRVIAEKELSLKLLESVPEPAAVSRPYREAAAYYLERAEWLSSQPGKDHLDQSQAAYQRTAALTERYLALLKIHPGSPRDQTDAEMLLSTAYQHLARKDDAVGVAARARAGDPFNPMMYRATASAYLSAGQADRSAIELMTGFMLTGNNDLRAALAELYRSGLDREGCALQSVSGRTTLNPQCGLVRRHLCAAAYNAAAVHRQNGRTALADQAIASVRDLHCEPAASAR